MAVQAQRTSEIGALDTPGIFRLVLVNDLHQGITKGG
jgi:hypothetical protein